MTEAPYGTWRSPISARDVARGGVRLGGVSLGGDGSVWWSEARPGEGGRTVVVRRGPDRHSADVVPGGWNVRTKAHEYGGGDWLTLDDGRLVFASWKDQRLYVVGTDGGHREPVPLTPEPSSPQGDRYADLVVAPGGSHLVCVREHSRGDAAGVARDIVSVPLDASQRLDRLVADGHFVSNPRPSPDGRHLCWLTWEHPRMPWDGTELRVAELSRSGVVGEPRTVMGGDEESVFQPEWASEDALYAVSDRTGWWNLYRVRLAGDITALCEREEEFGVPQWVFGMATYGVLDDGRVAVTHGHGARSLSLLDPATGALVPAVGAGGDGPSARVTGSEFVSFEPQVATRGQLVATIAGGPTQPLSVVALDASNGHLDVVRSSVDEVPERGYLPVGRPAMFPGPGGREVHGLVCAPQNRDYQAPATERAPYVAYVHGGPTAQSSPVLDVATAYFTSRGIGVVKVDYGGSTGYGREYRNRLRGMWGIVDVEDVVAAVQGLAEQGLADPDRLVIRGGSAGGWTVLAALTATGVFAGGVSYYGVADLKGLAEDTHDFESRYLDGLVGPLPESEELYAARSPLSHVDDLECPVLLLQGSDDKVVPPAQAEAFREALRRKGIAHAYLRFDGEQHGFRRAETIQTALEAELSFYGQVLGFEPADVPALHLER